MTSIFTLEYSKPITPNVLHLAFAKAANTEFNYIPGQFITIHFDWENKHYKRSYSIASIPGQTELIEVAASYIAGGPGTEFLYHLKPGDAVEVSGPHGRLVLRDEKPKRYILVATGTGITPYRSMLPELTNRIQQDNLSVVVLLGVQNRDDLLYGEDFIAMAQRFPQFDFRVHYSRQMPDDVKPFEYSGYVQTAFPALNLQPNEDIIYLCGNPSMIDQAFMELKERGFDPSNVRREKYVSSPAK